MLSFVAYVLDVGDGNAKVAQTNAYTRQIFLPH